MKLQAAIVRGIGFFKPLEEKIILLGELLGYQQWVGDLPGSSRPLGSRELVWRQIPGLLQDGETIRVLEFGVAWGYMTNWWFSEQSDQIRRWDGYDRFTGLPRSWRDLDQGAFDAGGSPPPTTDPRLTWHIGDIEDTLEASLTADRLAESERVLYVFDLDLFEPSLHCWQVIQPLLKSGDLLYFDEAFDGDERKLLEQHVLASGVQLEAVAHSSICLLMKVL